MALTWALALLMRALSAMVCLFLALVALAGRCFVGGSTRGCMLDGVRDGYSLMQHYVMGRRKGVREIADNIMG